MRYWLLFILMCCGFNSYAASDFTLKSAAFADKAAIPKKYTCDEGNMSPPISWANPPANTKSFALTLSSLDTPLGNIFIWILYNIPASLKGIPEGEDNLPDAVTIGQNSLDETAYRGPCPVDDENHHYLFTLYALDDVLELPSGLEGDALMKSIRPHIIEQVDLHATFQH